MLAVEGTATIARPANDIIDFVLDLDRYKQADTKISRVVWSHLDGDQGEVRYAGSMHGMPGPAMVNTVAVDRPHRIDFRSKPGTWQHAFLHFHGSFVLGADGTATRVVHREEFGFPPPLRWVLEPMLRRWLERSMVDEMARLKQLLEVDAGA